MIRGLRCRWCQDQLGASGVSCTACGAVFHQDCLRRNGRCASCECSKEPVPFQVEGQPTLSNASALMLALGLAISMAIFLRGRWSVPGPSAPELTLRNPSPHAPEHRLAPADHAAARVIDARTGDLEDHPGWISARLGHMMRSGCELEFRLGTRDFTAVLLQIKVRGLSRPQLPALLRARVARADGKGPGAPDWVTLAPVEVEASGMTRYRIDSPRPFNRLRMQLEHLRDSADVERIIALEPVTPAGRVLQTHSVLMVRGLDGQGMVLASQTGKEVRLPAAAVSSDPFGPQITDAVGHPDGLGLLALVDGQLRGCSPPHVERSWTEEFDFGGLTSRRSPETEPDPQRQRFREWARGPGAWALLSRWVRRPVQTRFHADSIDVTLNRYSDGGLELAFPHPGGVRCFHLYGTFHLKDLCREIEDIRPENVDPNWKHGSPVLSVGSLPFRIGTPEMAELVRFLKQKALPESLRLDALRTPVRAGSRVVIGWVSFPWSVNAGRTLQVTVVGDREVVLRGSRLDGIGGESFLSLPRWCLPETPPPRVGMWLDICREPLFEGHSGIRAHGE